MDASRLKDVPLFASLSHREREQVARWADEVEVAEGRKIVPQDAFGYEFFVIEEGEAEVVKDGELLRELGPGDFFGEIALLEAERRTASVVARSPMQLVVLHRRDFRHIQREMPKVAEQVEQALRERFRSPSD